MQDQPAEHLGGAADGLLHAFQHLRQPRHLHPVGDLQRRELRVLHQRGQHVLEHQIGLGIEPAVHRPVALDDAVLKAAARRLGGLAFGQVGEQQHEAEHTVRRGVHRVGAHQQGLGFALAGRQRHLAAPGAALARQLGQAAADFAGVGQHLQQPVQRPRRGVARWQQAAEGIVGQQDPAARIGHDHRLPGQPHLPRHLRQLVLRDQQPHRAELQHHVRHRLADQAGGGEIGRTPGVGRALDQLVPLRERAAGRQIGRVVADLHRLERVAAPGDGAHPLRPEPDQIFAGRVRYRRRHQAADRGRQPAELWRRDAERGGGDHAARLLVQPRAELAQLLGARHVAGDLDLALVQQRGAGGPQRLQHRLRGVEQRGAPIPLARDRLDHALFQAADRHLGLPLGEAFERRDAGADRLGQQLAHRADLEMHEARHVMVAGHQPPQPPADHQRDHQRRAHAHVAQILHVDRRDAAQHALRHVEGRPLPGRLQRRRHVFDIGQHPHAVALVQAAGDLRDVGGRVAVAEEGFQAVALLLGQHLAVPLLVEAIDHHAVVAGQVAEQPGRAVRQRDQRAGVEDGGQGPLDMHRQIDRGAGRFQLDHQPGAGWAVQQQVEGAFRLADMAAHGDRHGIRRVGQMRADHGCEIAAEIGKAAADQPAGNAEKRGGVGAGARDHQIGFAQQQQRAMRLDRAGQMDLLAFAV